MELNLHLKNNLGDVGFICCIFVNLPVGQVKLKHKLARDDFSAQAKRASINFES